MDKDLSGTSLSGYIFAILAAAAWAVSGTLSKALFNSGLTPLQLVQLRTTTATAFMFICLLLGARRLLVIRRQDLMFFAALGAALAVSQFSYLYAISSIQVAVAILLQYQSPVLIALYMYFFRGVRLSRMTMFAVTLAITGCYFAADVYSHDMRSLHGEGLLAGIMSAVTFAVYAVRSEKGMKHYHPLTVTFFGLAFAALFWNIFQVPLSAFRVEYSPGVWAKIGIIGVGGTVLPFFLFNLAVRRIGTIHTSVTSTLEPVFAGVVSYYYLGETLGFHQLGGALLVILAVIMLQSATKPERNT